MSRGLQTPPDLRRQRDAYVTDTASAFEWALQVKPGLVNVNTGRRRMVALRNRKRLELMAHDRKRRYSDPKEQPKPKTAGQRRAKYEKQRRSNQLTARQTRRIAKQHRKAAKRIGLTI